MLEISERTRSLGTENAFVVLKEVNELISQGKDVVNFCIGQPDFDTPEYIKEAAIKAIKDGKTGYTPSPGIPELREAVAEYFSESRNIDVKPEWVVVANGAKPFISYVILSVTDYGKGEEVLYPNPGFPIYESQIRASGAVPVPLPLLESKGYAFDVEYLERKINEKTRLLILNSPHNPTGGVLDKDTLEQIADIVKRHENLWVFSDEVYSHMVHDGEFVSIASFPGMQERTIIVDGVSKTYAMTGWRIGFAAGPKYLIDNILTIQQHSTSGPSTFAQKGCVGTLSKAEELVKNIVETCRRNRDLIVKEMSEIEGIECPKPPGAFYIFPAAEKLGLSGTDLMFKLLDHGVAIAPGELFGEDFKYHFRMCYAMPEDLVKEGLERMKSFFQQLKQGVK